MRKFVNYFFLILGVIYVLSGLLMLFQQEDQEVYTVFFGFELSRNGYIIYKTLIGLVLILITIVDLRRNRLEKS